MQRSSSSFGLPGGRMPLTTGLCVFFAVTLALALPAGTHGQPPPISSGATWTSQGPGPAIGGQSENASPDDAIAGAIHTILPHPTDSKIIYIGATNGGVWRTVNAQSTNPNWKPLTDGMPTSAIGALERDPTDPTVKTIWAGVGRFSSFSRLGGNRVGLYKTTDGGDTWTSVTGGGILLGKNISGVAPRGSVIVISVDTADAFTFPNIGIWRSADGGATFTQIGVGNGSLTGLPGGVTHDLVGDPNQLNRLFTSVIFANSLGGLNGVYRSNDTGATWSKVSNAAIDALLISGTTSSVEFAVGNNNNVYVAIANSGRLAGLFRSGDGGGTWTAMDLPRTGPNNVGIHPGAQASFHMSIVADPTADNIVYIGGDRQPRRSEEGLPAPGGFPNSIGAQNFSGRLFRCDASLAAGSQCTPLTHIGTASNSSPHADSREMMFDASGNLLESDDGGIYRRTSPRTAAGDWHTIVGNLHVSEQHDLSYDARANTIFVGTQDNDDPYQDSPDWVILLSGDGGDTAVDTQTLAPQRSIRYDSAQGLQAFVRTYWNAANNLQSFIFPALTVVGGGPAFSGQFTTPVELNAITPTRIIFGGANGVYESYDQGDTIRAIAPGIVINGNGLDAVSYGTLGNPDFLVVGFSDRLYIRTAAHPAPLTQVLTYPGTGTGRTVRDIVIDPDNAGGIYLTNLTQVFRSVDGGTTWTDVSGNIQSFAPIALRAIEYIPRSDSGGTNDALVVSTFNGLYVAYESTGFTQWSPLGTGLPNVPIFDLDFDAQHQILVAGTLGRGAWKLGV